MIITWYYWSIYRTLVQVVTIVSVNAYCVTMDLFQGESEINDGIELTIWEKEDHTKFD